MSLTLQVILSVVSKLPKPIRNNITPAMLTTTWGRIFVTTEVSVTREVGPFHPRKHPVEVGGKLHSTSSHQNLTMMTTTTAMLDRDSSSQGGGGPPDSWEPFVGDKTTGLGKNEAVVEAPGGGKRSGGFREVVTCCGGLFVSSVGGLLPRP